MFTTTVFLLCSVALAPSGCPTGHCSGTHIGHFGQGNPGFIHGADSFLGDEVLLVEDGAIDGFDAKRSQAPVVRLRGFRVGVRDTEGELTSSDKPALWPAVPMGSYTVLVELLAKQQEVDRLGYVQLLLDGKVLDNQRYFVARSEPVFVDQDQFRLTYTYRLPCPGPGKHLLQARYLSDSWWSHLSRALRFDAQGPRKPQIVGVGPEAFPPVGVPEGRLVEVTSDVIRLKLADVHPADNIVAYVDGRPAKCAAVGDACCYLLRVTGHVEPGIHRLTVRAVSGCDCGLASESSDSLSFHYHVERHYMIGLADDWCQETQLPCPCPAKVPTEERQTRSSARQHPGAADRISTPLDAVTSTQGDEVRAIRFVSLSAAADLQEPQEKEPAVDEKRGDEKPAAAGKPADRASNAPRDDGKIATITFLEAAYFPLREFGANGEVIDREGAVIYEDMQFTYGKNGDFRVHFRASLPPVPTTLQLRFLLQREQDGAWYTVTLEPMRFEPAKDSSDKPQRGTIERDIRGHSEAIGSCKIRNLRREGTARFGFGLVGLSQNATQ